MKPTKRISIDACDPIICVFRGKNAADPNG
jgi:hypothetical protein